MGNKLCKKKSENSEPPKSSTTPFDRIITRLHLRPSSWKSETHLNQNKQVTSLTKPGKGNGLNNKINTKPLSKSSDWTDASLEVPSVDGKNEHVHLRNPKLSLIFNKDNGTPTPPPRKHKKGIREKIEAVAKNSLQAFQSKKPAEEPLCVKKTINYECPCGDMMHHRNHHKHQHINETKKDKIKIENLKSINKQNQKDIKRKKNLSVVSLPNYNELKFTVANFDDIDDTYLHSNKPIIHNSHISLNDTKKTPKNYMIRCRSFGSLLPQQLLGKLRPVQIPQKKMIENIESDDSFGPLEDWDLGLIEHYNPRDASLPRPRKLPKSEQDLVSDIESLIVKEDTPVAPVRKSESLLKKLNKDAEIRKSTELLNAANTLNSLESRKNQTPPPSPEIKKKDQVKMIKASELPTEEDGKVEHSTLMKILEEFSIKDAKQHHFLEDETFPEFDVPLIDDDEEVKDKKSTNNNKVS